MVFRRRNIIINEAGVSSISVGSIKLASSNMVKVAHDGLTAGVCHLQMIGVEYIKTIETLPHTIDGKKNYLSDIITKRSR